MRNKLMRFAVALAVAFGIGGAVASPAHALGAPVYLDGRSPAAPPVGAPLADNLKAKPAKALRAELPAKGKIGGVQTLVACGSGCHHYAAGSDDTNTNATIPSGMSANVTVAAPSVDTADGGIFSLVQFSAREITGGTQYVEVGLIVHPSVFGDTNVHTFGSKWVNGAWCGSFTGVGTCGGSWVDNAGNAVNLGSSVQGDVGTTKQLTLQFLSGNWWLGYNGNWLGYFTTGGANNWPTTFDQIRLAQAFWETTTTQDPLSTDCTDMGNGTLAAGNPTPAGAQIGSITYRDAASANLPAADVNMGWYLTSSPGTAPGSSAYNIAGLSTRTARGGGSGVC